MRKEGAIVITTEIQYKVDAALRKVANEIGMEIEQFAVVAHLVIKDWFDRGGMVMTDITEK